ncbi:hypothetical protein SDC9_189487 [bioreactor metagenome]|uniref:Uncharacterized protein n=1 Tax=bioreactor metagenome TaxID=1076179 RepID=A0A645HTY3_9ZZZZ
MAAQASALFARYDVPVTHELFDPHGFAEIPAEHPFQGLGRNRTLAEQAGQPGNRLVVDGARGAAQAFTQCVETQATERQYQRQKTVLSIGFVQDRQAVFLPGTIKMADRAVGEQIEKGASGFVFLESGLTDDLLGVVDRQGTVDPQHSHETGG